MVFKRRHILVVLVGLFALSCALVACAPRVGQAKGPDPGLEFESGPVSLEWSAASECKSCHTDEDGSFTDSLALASWHQPDDCSACHSDTAGLAAQHQASQDLTKMPKKLRATDVPNDLCLSCHFDSVEELVSATGTIPDTVDINGRAENPHQSMVSEKHQLESVELYCRDCHSVHSGKPIEETTSLACLSCHHAGVFECYTCHE